MDQIQRKKIVRLTQRVQMQRSLMTGLDQPHLHVLDIGVCDDEIDIDLDTDESGDVYLCYQYLSMRRCLSY
jgi:hypothetical protein